MCRVSVERLIFVYALDEAAKVKEDPIEEEKASQEVVPPPKKKYSLRSCWVNDSSDGQHAEEEEEEEEVKKKKPNEAAAAATVVVVADHSPVSSQLGENFFLWRSTLHITGQVSELGLLLRRPEKYK